MVRAPVQTSRLIQSQLVTLENELADKLQPFINIMIRFGLPAESFQINNKLQFSIYGIIRKYTQDSYLVGLTAVENLIKKRIPAFELFMSGTDIQTIKDLSKEMIDSFWITVTKLLQRENQIRQQKITLETKKGFDKLAAIVKISSFVIYSGYNAAIDSKLKNILPSPPTATRAGSTTRTGSSFTDFDPLTDSSTIDEPFGELSILDNLQELLDEMMEMFLTKEDQDVDPAICEPLNRAVFKIDEPDKPDPPMHPHCRCILVPVQKEVSAFLAS
jgi:hypothetical protein